MDSETQKEFEHLKRSYPKIKYVGTLDGLPLFDRGNGYIISRSKLLLTMKIVGLSPRDVYYGLSVGNGRREGLINFYGKFIPHNEYNLLNDILI